jgi:hypothetical protein
VERAESLDGNFDQASAIRDFGDVARTRDGHSAVPGDASLDLGQMVRAACAEDHGRARRGRRDGHLSAQPGSNAGYCDDFALE